MNQASLILKSFTDRVAIVMVALGLSSGLPYLMIFGTLSLWLRESGIARGEIGVLSYLTLAYSLKLLWAPVVDTYRAPLFGRWLGRRRGWILLAQLVVAAGLVGMAFAKPAEHLGWMVGCALVTAFASATQDTVIDAWRIEAVADERQGQMAASYQLGYRAGLIIAGAGALYMAEIVDWTFAYCAVAACMAIGVVGCLAAPNVALTQKTHADLKGLWLPAWEFLRRLDKTLLLALALVASYRLPDILGGVMANSLYIDLGFDKIQIANVTKIYGVAVSVIGAIAGGVAVARYGLRAALIVGLVIAATSQVMFTWLASAGADIGLLTATISYDNFASGFAGTALIAYMSAIVSRTNTATEFAILSSLFALPGRLLGGLSGYLVDWIGYPWFYLATALVGLPILGLCLIAPRSFTDR